MLWTSVLYWGRTNSQGENGLWILDLPLYMLCPPVLSYPSPCSYLRGQGSI